MKFSCRFLFAGLAAACLLAQAQLAHAVAVNFIVDPAGTANGLVGIAPTSANRGNYAAGSYLSLAGNISATASGITVSGAYTPQVASSGVFSTGNPGSLLDFFSGGLLVTLDSLSSPSTIELNPGNAVTGTNYNKAYAENPGNPVFPLSPAIGGGVIGTPGSDPADYGVSISLKAFGLIVAASGTAALRGVVADVENVVPLVGIPLSGPAGNQTFVTNGNLQLAMTNADIDYNLKGAVVLGNTVPDLVGTGGIGSNTYVVTTDGAGTLTATALGGGQTLLRLAIPVQILLTTIITGSTPATINTSLSGQVAAFAIVPEPATVALVGMGLLSLAPVGVQRWRRRRSKTG